MTEVQNKPEFDFYRALKIELEDDDLYFIIKNAEALTEEEKEALIRELNLKEFVNEQ